MPITIEPISDAVGAQVTGIDLCEEMSDKTFKIIHRASLKHQVLVFPGQKLEEEHQVRFTGRFGELGGRARNIPTAEGDNVSHPGTMLISNIRKDGKPIGSLPDGEMMFHSDTPYYEKPLKATMLYALEIPSHGGNTLFSNSYRAAETLPEEIKQRISHKKALHIYDYGNQHKTAESYSKEIHPHFAHPIFRKHPETGRSALFVSELMTEEILGVSKQESQDLLNLLFQHQSKNEFVYEHQWRVGDLMLWDNRCSVHARTDFPKDERRMLRRTTLEDEHPVLPGSPPFKMAAAQ